MELPPGGSPLASGSRGAPTAFVPGSSAPAGLGLGSGALAKLAASASPAPEVATDGGNPTVPQTLSTGGRGGSPARGSSMEAPPTPPSSGRKAEHQCATLDRSPVKRRTQSACVIGPAIAGPCYHSVAARERPQRQASLRSLPVPCPHKPCVCPAPCRAFAQLQPNLASHASVRCPQKLVWLPRAPGPHCLCSSAA